MPRNRRRHSRIKKRLKVEFGEQAFDHKGILNDISIGGIFISAGRLFKQGTRLHLHVVDPSFDFYAEGVVVRLKRVDQLLRRIEAQGMGIRLMSPAEVIRSLIPRVARAVDTRQVVCSDPEQLQKLINEQLVAGVLVVPVTDPPPAPNTAVEFFIRVDFGDSPRTLGGEGRIMQILDQGKIKQAVLEVKDAAKLRAALEVP
jgi:PilZ domain